MAFFFIPAGVAIMDNVSFLAGRIPLVLFIVVLTLVITFGISTLTATLTMNLIKKRKDRYHD
jgi:holin-like protein